MNIVFFGSSSFSVPALQSINPHVVCVVTKKAKPKGRGYTLEDNEVKKASIELKRPVIEIATFKDEEAHRIKEFKPELLVVASFGLILPQWVLDLPSRGAINVHPSLLPKYRGPSPMQWALWNGERETGITIISMNEKMDAGDIIYQESTEIYEQDNMITLSERLSKRVSEILPPIIKKIENEGIINRIVQNHDDATYTPIITKDMGKIDWSMSALEIVRQIRALVMWPTAFTILDEQILKIFDGEAHGIGKNRNTGIVVQTNRQGFFVTTGSGMLMVKEVQLENKKRMKASEFANGYRRLVGKRLG